MKETNYSKKAFKFLFLFPLISSGLFVQTTAADTIAKIQKTGKIIVGHRETSTPISYMVGKQPIGYALDICNSVVKDLKKELNMPNLKVEYKPVTSATRIPELLAGNIDIECGTTTNTKQRQQQASFSVSYYATEVRMAVKANSGIKKFADLNGKTVVTTQGTTSDKYIKLNQKKNKIKVNIVYGKDHSDSFSMVANGRAAAFVMDDNLLAGLISKSSNPKTFAIVGPILSSEPYGIMFAKNDPKFKKFIDQKILAMWRSGTMDSFYKKWFQSPIPPTNVNLQLAPNSSFNALKKKPTDVGI